MLVKLLQKHDKLNLQMGRLHTSKCSQCRSLLVYNRVVIGPGGVGHTWPTKRIANAHAHVAFIGLEQRYDD